MITAMINWIQLYDWLEATGGTQIPLNRTANIPNGDYKYP